TWLWRCRVVRVEVSGQAGAVLRYYLDQLVLESYPELTPAQEPGLWLGKLAERLGLKGAVTRESFAAMLGNIDPRTGASLTPRTMQDRRAAYEFEVSGPKSLSVLHALTNDPRLYRAFVDAVKDLMRIVENTASTRVRR